MANIVLPDYYGNPVTLVTSGADGSPQTLSVTSASGAAGTSSSAPSYVSPALLTSGTPTKFPINKSTMASAGIVSGTVGQVIRVFGLRLNTATDVNVIFQSASNTISETFYMRASSYTRDIYMGGLPLFQTVAGEDLNWALSADVAVSGFIYLVKS